MKTKVLFLIAGAAILTLSFSFVSSTQTRKPAASETSVSTSHSEPIGGFVAEDKL